MKTVLIVDDISFEVEAMAGYLVDAGYQVISATNVDDALEKALHFQPDLVVTDLIMPRKSGYDLCQGLKAHPDTDQIPIIICSSKQSDLSKMWALKQGATIYITKPYTSEILIRSVDSLIN